MRGKYVKKDRAFRSPRTFLASAPTPIQVCTAHNALLFVETPKNEEQRMTSVRYEIDVSVVGYAFAKFTATAKGPVRLDLTAGGSAGAHALRPF